MKTQNYFSKNIVIRFLKKFQEGFSMKSFSLILIFSILISSCSFLKYEREPASAGVLQTEDEVVKVFQYRSSNIHVEGVDYGKAIQEYIEKNKIFAAGFSFGGNQIAVSFVEDQNLPKDIAYLPLFEVKNNQYMIRILHSPGALQDKVASAELANFLTMFKNQKYFMSPYSAFEMYYNAIELDPVATQNWAKIREISAGIEASNDFTDQETKEALKQRAVEWSHEKEDYTPAAQKELKLQKKMDLERRAVIEALDKASDDQQFKNLVAKNDRKGVADLLKKYLPWEQMAPFEKQYWETYLDVVQHPVPMDQRVLIYRGVQDDFIYSAYKGGKEIDKDIAQKEGNVFVMSSLMTKNQGTWNRRLRSLTTMNEKFIATNTALENEFTKSARMVTMFVKHSANPKGSPFLSFTPKFSIAYSFGQNKMSAHAIDPRLLSFNFASYYSSETEFLLPLTTFPEDMVGFYSKDFHPEMQNTEEQMLKLFKAKLVAKEGEAKAEEIYNQVLKNSKEYFDIALNRYSGKMTGKATNQPENLFTKFFKNMFDKKPMVPMEVHAPKTGLACIDIISSFWK